MHCPNILSPQWKNLVEKIGETNAWREFFKYGTIPNAENYNVNIDSNVFFALKSCSINNDLSFRNFVATSPAPTLSKKLANRSIFFSRLLA